MYRQTKQSIQVTIRIRPLCDRQVENTQEQDNKLCIKQQIIDSQFNQRLTLFNGIDNSKSFAFDQIIGVSEDQQAVFERVGKNSIIKCLEGYNCSIFAYGQTGAGKTFTMMGVGYENPLTYQKRGLIPRTLQYLFSSVEKQTQEKKTQYLIVCKFLEIYNETIIDLLDKNNKNLQLRQDLKKGVYVEGLSEATVTRPEQALELLRKGSKGRHVGSTFYNDTSSRSHSVYTLQIQSKSTKNSVTNVKQRSFHFIDLAGSERTKLLNQSRFKEGCSINKSLHVLGMVINSLVESTQGKAKHVGYRDSKLTFLLKDSLGGNSKTHIIANISPSMCSYNQTLSTLSFAKRVKLIKIDKASINEDTTGSLQTLKLQIVRLKQQILQFKSNNVGSHLVSMQSMDPDTSHITQLAIKNQGQLQLQKLFKQYVDEAIEKQTKMQVEVLKCLERLKLIQQQVSKDCKLNYSFQYQNQINISQTLKYNIDHLKKLSNILLINITDRQNITHILQNHPNNTYSLPYHSQSPLKTEQKQVDYSQKYEQLILQVQILKQTIKQNELIISLYQQNQQKSNIKIQDIIEQHTKVLQQIKQKYGGQLNQMQKYQQQMQSNINRMTLQLLQLKQQLILKQDQISEIKSKNKTLSEELNHSNSKFQSVCVSQQQYLLKINDMKLIITQKDNQIMNLTKQLQQAVNIVNNVQIQFQQQKKNNTQRYKQVILTNQQTIWQLQKQLNKYKLQQVTYQKQKQINTKRSQQYYQDNLKRQTIITQLRQQLDDLSYKLQLEKNINKNQLNKSKNIQQQTIQARYQQLLNQKRIQLSGLQQQNESLKVQNITINNQLKLKTNIQSILNSRLQSQIARNRQIQEQLYQLKQIILQNQQKQIRQNRQIQSIKRKQSAIVQQLHMILKQKNILQQSNKTFQFQIINSNSQISQLKNKLQRKQYQIQRLKQTNIKQLSYCKQQYQQFKKRSHQNQQYFKQLFEQSNSNKQRTLNQTKKNLIQIEDQLVKQKQNISNKLLQIKLLNDTIKNNQTTILEYQSTINQKQSQLLQLKEQLVNQQSKFIIKLQQRQNRFNQFRQTKSQQIEGLEQKINQLLYQSNNKQVQQNKRRQLQQEYDIMRQNHKELLNDYSIDMKQKQNEINGKQSTIQQLIQDIEQKNNKIRQLSQQIDKLDKIKRSQSQMTFKSSSDDIQFKYFELEQQHINCIEVIEDLNRKLQKSQQIIDQLDADNRQMTTQITNLNQQIQSITHQLNTLMRQKQLISSDLNDKIEEIQEMKKRWEIKRKQQLDGIQGQFKEYKEQTHKINTKLIKNYQLLKEQQDKYKQLVDRYEQVIQWNQKLVDQNNQLRQSNGQIINEQKQTIVNNTMRQSIMSKEIDCVLDIIEQQDSIQINRTQDITNTQINNNLTQSLQESNSQSQDIVNNTNQYQQQQQEFKSNNEYNNLYKQYQSVVFQLTSLQQIHQQLQQQYLKYSQNWQQQKQYYTHKLSTLQSQYQQEIYQQEQYEYQSKPRSTIATSSVYQLRKPRHSVNYQQQITLRLQLQKRGVQLQQLTGGILQICSLLNIKGLSHGNTRFKIQAIKSNIQNILGQLTQNKKQMRQKDKQMEMRNIRAQIKERQLHRIKSNNNNSKKQGVEGKGKSLRDVEEMKNQKSMLQLLHKRMKGQQNYRVNSNRLI